MPLTTINDFHHPHGYANVAHPAEHGVLREDLLKYTTPWR